MKNFLFLFAFLIAFGCRKQENTVTSPVITSHFSSQQVWDSVGFKYEKKYWASMPPRPDTLIFHMDHTVTEIWMGSSVTFKIDFIGSDSSVRRFHSGIPYIDPDYFSFENGMGVKLWSIPDTLSPFAILHYSLKSDTGFLGGISVKSNEVSISYLHGHEIYDIYTIAD
jgi:hypothetical protein